MRRLGARSPSVAAADPSLRLPATDCRDDCGPALSARSSLPNCAWSCCSSVPGICSTSSEGFRRHESESREIEVRCDWIGIGRERTVVWLPGVPEVLPSALASSLRRRVYEEAECCDDSLRAEGEGMVAGSDGSSAPGSVWWLLLCLAPLAKRALRAAIAAASPGDTEPGAVMRAGSAESGRGDGDDSTEAPRRLREVSRLPAVDAAPGAGGQSSVAGSASGMDTVMLRGERSVPALDGAGRRQVSEVLRASW